MGCQFGRGIYEQHLHSLHQMRPPCNGRATEKIRLPGSAGCASCGDPCVAASSHGWAEDRPMAAAYCPIVTPVVLTMVSHFLRSVSTNALACSSDIGTGGR